MEYNVKEGRRAHGHNGYHRKNGFNSPSHSYSEARPRNEVLKPKPQGSSKEKSGSSRTERSKKTGHKLHICTYNTRTLRTDDSLQHLIDELDDFKWDIIGLAETRREGDGLEELEGGAWL